MVVASYKIRLNGGSLVNYEQNVGNVTSWNQIDPSPATVSDTNYALEVKAIDDSGNESAYSAPVTVNTFAVGLDTDAQLFITAAGITDTTQKSAVNQLVIALKDASIWAKMQAIYPFVGGTDTTHKWNLKDPRNLDAAFRITFHGTITHSSTGALPDGSTGYADTHFLPSTGWANNDTHIAFYSRTNSLPGGVDFGVGDVGPSVYIQFLTRTDAIGGSQILSDAYNGRVNTTNSDSRGLFTQSVTNVSSHTVYANGSVLIGGGGTTQDITTVSSPIALFAENLGGSVSAFSNRECAFASIGSGLADMDVSSLYAAVQAFETTLGRQV